MITQRKLYFQGGKLFAATESFLPFEIQLTRERLEPVGFTTIGGMLEQKVGSTEWGERYRENCQGGPQGGNIFRTPQDRPNYQPVILLLRLIYHNQAYKCW